MDIELFLYTVCKEFGNDGREHGLPFIAVNDDFARKMVIDAFKKDVKKIPSFDGFMIYKVARYLPNDVRPVRMLKGAPVLISKVGDLFGSLGEVIDEKGDNTHE